MIGKIRRWLLAYGPSGSPDSLSHLERLLLSSLATHRSHNITAIALRHQLRIMLRMKEAPSFGGMPDWLHRKRSQDCLYVVQQRSIGDYYSFPWTGSERVFEFPFERAGRPCGVLRLFVDGIINRFEVQSTSLDALFEASEGDLVVGPGEWTDEREYWSSRGVPDDRLHRVNQEILATVLSGRFQNNVVVPAPPLAGRALFGDVAAPLGYQRLLNYSNGIGINGSSIWAASIGKQRVWGEDPARVLRIGDTEGGFYAATVDRANIATDRIRLFRHSGKGPEPEFKDAIALCTSLLR
jgi:hypothetical protein